jgi:hypothetical protein
MTFHCVIGKLEANLKCKVSAQFRGWGYLEQRSDERGRLKSSATVMNI